MEKVIKFMQKNLSCDTTGHGLDHALRVRNMALRIWEEEGGDKKIIETAALTHNMIDSKLFSNPEVQRKKLKEFLEKQDYEDEEIEKIIDLIEIMSYKGDFVNVPLTVEGKILQDAERLDQMGALGVVRTFTSAGTKAKKLYKNEQTTPIDEVALINYNQKGDTSINYFYDYLLKLKDLMNTETATKIATLRHQFMLNFLIEFYQEWKGIR